MRHSIRLLIIGLCLVSVAQAETIIFKDGTFVDGEIEYRGKTSIRVRTIYGTRAYDLRDIEKIMETPDFADEEAVRRFEELPDAMKAVFNARVDYRLGNYQSAFSRITPFLEYDDNHAIRRSIDWLVIDILERQARWQDARSRLEAKKKDGSPHEKLRAEAHLLILDGNPDYNLQYVGTRHARDIFTAANRELRDRSREPNALADVEIMRIALEEYCEQLLQHEQFSAGALDQAMNQDATLAELRKVKPGRSLERCLPYMEQLKKAEESISRAQAILPGYGDIYELQLIRIELEHFWGIMRHMIGELREQSPRHVSPAFDPQTGRLTRDGRKQLQEQCDRFVDEAKQLMDVIEYLQEKAARYPRKLDTLLELYDIVLKYHDSMIDWAKRLKRKSHV